MNPKDPLFIYFIPIIIEESGEITYHPVITEFEINKNKSDTLVVIMPNEFSINIDEDEHNGDHPSELVKIMFYNLIDTYPKLKTYDKIIIYHNANLDKYADLLYEIKNEYYGRDKIINDIIKIAREFYKRMVEIPYYDKKMYNTIRNYYKRLGLVDFDETDDLQKIIYDQLIKNREIILKKRKKIKSNLNKIALDYIGKSFKIQAENIWEKFKGKIIYYPPGILPIE